MTTLEELGLGPEVVDALSGVGIENATPFQEGALPVLGRGNNLVARAGPGGGVLVAVAAPLLDRLEAGAGTIRGLVLTPTRVRADALARSTARLARTTGHSVGALGSTWVRAEESDLLFATPGDALAAVRGSRIKLEGLEAFVLEGASALAELGGMAPADTLAGFVPTDAQRIVVSLPLTEEVEEFAERHARKAVHVPPRSVVEPDDSHIPHRGRVLQHTVDGLRSEALVRVVASLLEGGARRVAVFFHTEDEAAEGGDELALHGFSTGRPGDASAEVWLAVDEVEARRTIADAPDPAEIVTLSHRVPVGPDSLDRRHGTGGEGHTLLRGREIPHLRACAGEAGYSLEAGDGEPPDRLPEEIEEFRRALGRAVDEEDLAPYHLLLEPLLERYGSARVAAAAAALLRRRAPPATAGVAGGQAPAAAEGPPWVRLFVSLGQRDRVGPGDILGAITGEAGIDGSRVGRIEIRETFSLVEVDPAVAPRVIRAMNGITVKGRSVRVDYHRSRGGRASRRGSGSRGSGPPPSD